MQLPSPKGDACIGFHINTVAVIRITAGLNRGTVRAPSTSKYSQANYCIAAVNCKSSCTVWFEIIQQRAPHLSPEGPDLRIQWLALLFPVSCFLFRGFRVKPWDVTGKRSKTKRDNYTAKSCLLGGLSTYAIKEKCFLFSCMISVYTTSLLYHTCTTCFDLIRSSSGAYLKYQPLCTSNQVYHYTTNLRTAPCGGCTCLYMFMSDCIECHI